MYSVCRIFGAPKTISHAILVLRFEIHVICYDSTIMSAIYIYVTS